MAADQEDRQARNVPKKAVELEKYVAALFKQLGFCREERCRARAGSRDPPRLDAVVTSYETSPPQLVIVEAKSGSWARIFRVAPVG